MQSKILSQRTPYLGQTLMLLTLLIGVPVAPSLAATQIVCHRGANEYAPENTKAAAQLCIDWNVAYIEIDVRTSKDGVLYILHDATVNRTTNGKGAIAQLTSDQIDQLDAGSWFDPKFAGERVPRLESFLTWIKGKARVYLDVKAADPKSLIDLIYKLGMEHDCFFWFDTMKQAIEFRRLDEKLPLKMNADSSAELQRAHDTLQIQIIEVDLERMTAQLQQACRDLNVKLMIYEPKKNKARLRKAAEWKPDMVNVNHADLYRQMEQEVAGGLRGD